MDIEEWLFYKRRECNMNKKQFAKLLGIHPQHLTRVLKGKITPKMALRIEKMTGGQVKGWDLILRGLKEDQEIKHEQA